MAHFHSNALIGAGGAAGAAEYKIDRSLRFNSGDSSYLNRTPSSAGNRKTWTWSGWVKNAQNSGTRMFFAGPNSATWIFFQNNQIYADLNGSGNRCITDALYRDPSAWYHIVWRVDTTQATAADRHRIYVNGVLQTFSSSSYPSQNTDTGVNNNDLHVLGAGSSSAYHFDGYLADVYLIDGSSLAPTSFGEVNNDGIWIPKQYSGNFGTNGFHLKFDDKSSNAALGTDSSGNSNTWTVNNLTASALGTGTVSGAGTPANASGSGGWAQAFDGSTSTLVYNSNGSTTTTFTLADPIAWTSKIRIYAGQNGTSGTNISANGVNLSSSVTWALTGEWKEVTSHLTSPLTSLALTSVGGQSSNIRAVEIDNTVIVQGDAKAIDSLLDTPTNGDSSDDTGAGGQLSGNYCVINPLGVSSNTPTISDGMLKMVLGSSQGTRHGTMGVTSGKWYFEVVYTAASPLDGMVGVANKNHENNLGNYTGGDADGWGYYYNGEKYNNGGQGSYGASWGVNDVMGIALDMDNGALYFSKNGTYQNNGDPTSGSSKTGAAFTNLSGTIFPCINGYGGTQVVNFGQRAFNTNAPSGYKCWNTANLPDPTIADPSTAFDALTYTGNNTTGHSITGLGFTSDIVWIKQRTARDHVLMDSVRGTGVFLSTNTTAADQSNGGTGSSSLGIQSFDSNGFTLGTGSGVNSNNTAYVAWAWNAGTSTVSNTDGNITSNVRANTSAGISIVTYTGNSSIGQTIGHGLSAAPHMIWCKNRDYTDRWGVYHKAVGGGNTLVFNTNGAPTGGTGIWGNTDPTNSVFTVSNDPEANRSGSDYVAYCFAPVEGFSSIGEYKGNGSNDGPFVYTGMRPRWLMIKARSTVTYGNWIIHDTARSTFNVSNKNLYANLNNEEDTSYSIDILSNGFKIRSTNFDGHNGSGKYYTYIAFAENPFSSNGGLAR